MEFNCRSLKANENQSFVWLIESKGNVRQGGVIKQHGRHAFLWTPGFVSVELFKVKNTLKLGGV